jgi:DNA (cytosine-5)-methyltransferase 1
VIYGSVCSGIEAASVAWEPLGWKPSFFSEIEPFPRSVLAHRFPGVPLHGDFTTIEAGDYESIDLLVGGTPCQSFSVAGLRGGLADDRGNLALEYLRLAARLRPRWLVWENVPGVLSSDGGRDFGSILGGMVELGYGFAYRVLDAQYAGVPQRRRRVFIVGCSGDWRGAAAVLFERHSLQGHLAPRREAGKGSAAGVIKGAAIGRQPHNGPQCGDTLTDGTCYTLNCTEVYAIASTGDISHCLNAGGMGRQDYETETLIAHTLRGDGFDASEDGTGRGTPLVPVAEPLCFACQQGGSQGMALGHGVAVTLQRSQHPALAFNMHKSGNDASSLGVSVDRVDCLRAFEKSPFAVMQPASAVRRLTPQECERLQGFPDGWTDVPHRGKPAADGPRYKALGNSMAVPVMRWIGERIAAVEAITADRMAA